MDAVSSAGTELAQAAEADTELAGVADADTHSVYAWGQVSDLDELPEHWWTSGRITAAAVIVSALLAIAVGGVNGQVGVSAGGRMKVSAPCGSP